MSAPNAREIAFRVVNFAISLPWVHSRGDPHSPAELASVVLLHGWTCDGADRSWLASDPAVEFPDLVSAQVLVDPCYGKLDERAARATMGMDRDLLTTALAVFSGFYLADSPVWQRFWHERRLRAMPSSFLTTNILRDVGPPTLGRRSVAGPHLGQRRCPMLAVYAGVRQACVRHG